MTWFETLPSLLLSALLLLGIGAPVPAALRLRGVAFLAVAVASTLSSVALASVIAPRLGIGWSLLPPLAVSAVIAGVSFGLRRWLVVPRGSSAGRSEWGRPFRAQAAAIGIGTALTLALVMPAIGAPDHPSQSYDTVFHLNAVQWVLDTGNASPTAMTMTTPGRGSGFYPTTWHALVALLVQTSGVSVTVATNVMAVVVASLGWTTACVMLGRVLFGRGAFPTLLAGGLSAVFGAFPGLLLWFGILYPNLLAVSVLPTVLALLAAAVQRHPTLGLRTAGLLLLAGWAIGGMSLAHPNALFSLFVLSAPLAVRAVVLGIRRAPSDRRTRAAVGWIVGALALAAAEVAAFRAVTTADNGWVPDRTIPDAVREGLMNAPVILSTAWVLSGLMLIGLGMALLRRPRLRWVAIGQLLAVVFYTIAIAVPQGAFRTALTGVWYNDAYRLAAIAPVLGVPLAVLGTVTVARWVMRVARRRPDRAPGRSFSGGGVVMALVGVLAVAIPYVESTFDMGRLLAGPYRLSDRSSMLSSDEVALLGRVPDLVPEDAVVAGNPWNGSALVYAYTGRRTVFPHVGGAYPDAYWELAEGLADRTPEACAAAADLGVTHILDFGDRFIFATDDRADRYPGLTDVAEGPGLRLIAAEGDARLFEVDCP
ncbi:DUF6541 family protein [Agromyces sp. GXQ0307]|uniref:DUF6541 family protein n=1 Tax=Agromyces sp. GXQ0307 TaxID=3377835 RepID=UPI00383A8310